MQTMEMPENGAENIAPQTEHEIMIRELKQEIEEKYGDLKDKIDPGIYEELTKRVLQEKIENCEQLEELNNVTENKAEELFESLIDSTTGLKRRDGLFKSMDKKFDELFGAENMKNLGNEELLEIFNKHKADDFKSMPMNVMMGDMSYLSLVNKDGHVAGDELLGHSGKAIFQELNKAFRHGGDEFTALINLEEKAVKDKVKQLESSIKNIKNIPVLKKYKLDPNLDIGTAHFSEGFEAFKKIMEKLESRAGEEKLPALNLYKELQNVWLEIADKRSFIKKGASRIALLIDLKQERQEQYSEIINSIRKGGYDITDEELDGLIKEIQSGAGQDEKIFSFIKEKEDTDIRSKEGYDRDRSEVVFKIAKREFKLL